MPSGGIIEVCFNVKTLPCSGWFPIHNTSYQTLYFRRFPVEIDSNDASDDSGGKTCARLKFVDSNIQSRKQTLSPSDFTCSSPTRSHTFRRLDIYALGIGTAVSAGSPRQNPQFSLFSDFELT